MKKIIICVFLLLQSFSFVYGQDYQEGQKSDDEVLISFKIKISDPDESGGMSMRTSTSKTEVGGVPAMKTQWSAKGKSILEIYILSCPSFDDNRILYNKELEYIASKDVGNRYNVETEVSDKIGEFYTVLRKQLDIAFNLKSTIIEQETDVLILKEIKNSAKIKPLDNPGNPQQSNFGNSSSSHYIEMKGFVPSDRLSIDIGKLINYPVIADKNLPDKKYEVDLSLSNLDKTDIDDLIKRFREEGIILEKGKGKVQFLQIEKAE